MNAESSRSFPVVSRETQDAETIRRKDICRSKANVYLRRGKIERRPCQVCGDVRSQMHHHDYDKPLEVTWLCRNCHIEAHGLVLGGKRTCSRCDELHAPGSTYCKTHRAEYMRYWRRSRTARFHQLEAIERAMGQGNDQAQEP